MFFFQGGEWVTQRADFQFVCTEDQYSWEVEMKTHNRPFVR